MKKQLTYATVCSGVECMSVAAMGLPMRPVFFSEIEPFPCAVLKHHFPDVPNLGDMSKIEIKEIDNETKEIGDGRTTITLRGELDIFAGGTPCQDVSVAGKRRGMQEGSGTRSSLAFEFVRLIRGLRPRYVIWENVAGVLSDESFPKFLAALAECGYRVAYRTFDAQYVTCADITRDDIHDEDAGMDGDGRIELSRAVPQRRRRVWVVCSRIERRTGADVADPAAVLFEPAGVLGDHPPCRKSREEVAAAIGGRAQLHDRVVERTGTDGKGCASTITRQLSEQSGQDARANAVIERRVSNFKGNLAGGTEDTAAVSGDHDDRITDLTNVMVYEEVALVDMGGGKSSVQTTDGTTTTLSCTHGGAPGIAQHAVGVDFYNGATTGESAKTLNCAASDKDHTGGVIVTNSNGGDNQHNNGGGTFSSARRRSRIMSGNFEMYDMATGGECVSLNALRCVDTMVVEGE